MGCRELWRVVRPFVVEPFLLFVRGLREREREREGEKREREREREREGIGLAEDFTASSTGQACTMPMDSNFESDGRTRCKKKSGGPFEPFGYRAFSCPPLKPVLRRKRLTVFTRKPRDPTSNVKSWTFQFFIRSVVLRLL